MQSNNTKNKTLINADLHCHTFKSYDGFTSPKELLKACLIKKINLIAITEHDKTNIISKKKFLKKGITVIDGCEYTTDKGAHIIGLFVKNNLIGGNYREVIKHIKNQSGLVMIPHPFKKKSGIFDLYKNYEYILENSDIIELYNGGYKNTYSEKQKIITLSKKFKLKMVANSDSHKIEHFGYYINQFKVKNDLDLRDLLRNKEAELMVDKNFKRRPRKLNNYQLNENYQRIVLNTPFSIKRFLKIILYNFSNKKLHFPKYIKIK